MTQVTITDYTLVSADINKCKSRKVGIELRNKYIS